MNRLLIVLALVGCGSSSQALPDAGPPVDAGPCACDISAPGATDFESRTFLGSCDLGGVQCWEMDANPVACTTTTGATDFRTLACIVPEYCANLSGVWTPNRHCMSTYCPTAGEHAPSWTTRLFVTDPTACPSAMP